MELLAECFLCEIGGLGGLTGSAEKMTTYYAFYESVEVFFRIYSGASAVNEPSPLNWRHENKFLRRIGDWVGADR